MCLSFERNSLTTSLATSKQSLRRAARAIRRALTPAEQTRHATAVARTIAARLDGRDTVAVYLARDGELSLEPLIGLCWRRGIALAVPVINGRDLRFATYRENEPMRCNRFGIPEPVAPAWAEPSIVLAPLVAFDDRGRRLGMGGGYYDRYFATRAALRRVGVAHECQRTSEVPATASDIALGEIVTECGWRKFSKLADTGSHGG